jgi:hypothetical protein
MNDRFAVCGLTVASDVPLPGADSSPDGEADLVMAQAGRRVVPATIAEGRRLQAVALRGVPQYSTVEQSDGSVLLRVHGLVDFLIHADRRSVLVWRDPACSVEMLGILAAGNLIATVLMLRGETALHASAVESSGRAVAFVAHSGMGKSTLASLACAQGARFVTDDLLRIVHGDDGVVRCHRGSAESRLRRPVSDVTGHASASWTSADGRRVWCPQRSLEPQPELAAVVLPIVEDDRQQIELEKLSPGRAVVELTMRPRLLGWNDAQARANVFTDFARLARSVPVVRARLPWGPPFDPALPGALLAAVGVPLPGALSDPRKPAPVG